MKQEIFSIPHQFSCFIGINSCHFSRIEEKCPKGQKSSFRFMEESVSRNVKEFMVSNWLFPVNPHVRYFVRTA